MNLRQRIRYTKISCIPWSVWRGEIELLPVSSKCLFAKCGMQIDIWEEALLTEGFLYPDEVLLEVLKDPINLKRVRFGKEEFVEPEDIGEFPDDWTDEDYIDFYNRKAG